MRVVSGLSVLVDGCDGDRDGLVAALGDGWIVVFVHESDEGYGHHTYEQVFKLADGSFIHAECGGCSCGGSGSWSAHATEAEAMSRVPEYHKERAS